MIKILKNYLTKEARLYLIYFLTHFVYLFILRVIFLFTFSDKVVDKDFAELAEAFYIGIKFDLRLCAILSLLFAFIFLIPGFNIFRSNKGKVIVALLSTILAIITIYFYFFDFGFFSYLGTRMNAASLKFLENPLISAQMIWESYPILWAILFSIVFGFLHYRWVTNLLEDEVVHRYHYLLKRKLISFSICFVFFTGSVYGKLGYYPLRWSEAYFSTNSFISNFSLNPVLNFFDTLRYSEKTYDKQLVEKYYPYVSDYLGIDSNQVGSLNYKRLIKPKDKIINPPNVVIIVLESLAANKTSLFQNELDSTPYLKKLSESSVFFNRFYTPTEATARGLFAIMTGIPDVSATKTSSRNPMVVNQHTIVNEFKDYQKYYFLGGSANWGNIRGIFSYNVDNIHIFEEGSYQSPRNDVWGISDLDLFIEANTILAKEAKRPFFALIQTAGFHRPYTIPENSRNFTPLIISDEKLKRHSFSSLEELNSLRFQDYSFGHFMGLAKNESYYKNTIFIVMGDHGLPAPESVAMPKGEVEFGLTIHHTPLLIHYPVKLKPTVIDKVASQLDVVPTVASLVGIEYTNTTLGRDLFNPDFDEKRFAFTYSWHERPRRIGLVDKEFYYLESPSRKGLYRFLSEEPLKEVSSEFPEKLNQMKILCEGLYETSRYMLYNNPKFK